MLCVLCLIVLWGFSLVTSYSGVIDYNYALLRIRSEYNVEGISQVNCAPGLR